MIYAHDTTTPDGGRTVRSAVYNTHSGVTVMTRDFKGPLKAIRSEAWGDTWTRRLEADRLRPAPDGRIGWNTINTLCFIGGLMWMDMGLAAVVLWRHFH